MALTNLEPRTDTITGSDLSGSDGGTNRTYSLSFSNALTAGINIVIENASLQKDQDFTFSSGTVTFLNQVFDNQDITINYFTQSQDLSTAGLQYTTTQQLAETLGIKKDVPSWDVGETPTNENVGTGDNSETIFYLDHQNIINNTLTLSHGSTASSTTELDETDDYTIDLNTGKITLTGTGVTAVGNDNIYAEYSYNDAGIPDSVLQDILERAEARVDNLVNTTFTDGTDTNPSYPSVVDIQDSKGFHDRAYFTQKRPVKDVESTLSSDVGTGDSTLPIQSSDIDNFPTSGFVCVGDEKISYSGVGTASLTGLTRGVDDSSAGSHSSGDEVHTTVVEVSSADEGTDPTFTVLEWKSDVFVDESLGKVYIYRDESIEVAATVADDLEVEPDVPNRVRMTYFYGHDTVPKDITRLTLLLAKKMIVTDTISKSMIKGRDEFQPEMVAADDAEINEIINTYRKLQMANT